MALMQITVIPLGTSSPSVGKYVIDVIQLLDSRKVEYTLNDMGTIIEGKPADLLLLAADIHNLSFNKGVDRVVTHIVLDERRDKTVHLDDKYKSVLNAGGDRSKNER